MVDLLQPYKFKHMDFPLNLNKRAWVTGTEELEQIIKMLLKNPIHLWLQSYSYGSLVSLHSTSLIELETNVRETLRRINGLTVNTVSTSNNLITVKVIYNKRELEYGITLN